MENNLVPVQKENFFTKIKNLFKSLFNKKEKQVIVNEVNNNVQKNSAEYEKNKKEIFELYDKFKKHELNLENVPMEHLLKIQELMKEEIKIKESKNNELINELDECQKNIRWYENEISKLERKIAENV